MPFTHTPFVDGDTMSKTSIETALSAAEAWLRGGVQNIDIVDGTVATRHVAPPQSYGYPLDTTFCETATVTVRNTAAMDVGYSRYNGTVVGATREHLEGPWTGAGLEPRSALVTSRIEYGVANTLRLNRDRRVIVPSAAGRVKGTGLENKAVQVPGLAATVPLEKGIGKVEVEVSLSYEPSVDESYVGASGLLQRAAYPGYNVTAVGRAAPETVVLGYFVLRSRVRDAIEYGADFAATQHTETREDVFPLYYTKSVKMNTVPARMLAMFDVSEAWTDGRGGLLDVWVDFEVHPDFSKGAYPMDKFYQVTIGAGKMSLVYHKAVL